MFECIASLATYVAVSGLLVAPLHFAHQCLMLFAIFERTRFDNCCLAKLRMLLLDLGMDRC